MRFVHTFLARRHASKPNAGRAEAGLVGWAAGTLRQTFKGTVFARTFSPEETANGEGQVAPRVGIEAVEEKQGCVTLPEVTRERRAM